FDDSDRYDIVAKAPGESVSGPMDMDAMAPMLRALLADRFKMKYHTEERPLPAFNLVAAKPKLKKAEPGSRTFCRNENAPSGSPPGSRALVCQNATMALLAERLRNSGPDMNGAIADATGIEGGWDFTLVY